MDKMIFTAVIEQTNKYSQRMKYISETDSFIDDFTQLEDKEKDDLHRRYPREDIGEGWFGKEKAKEIVEAFFKLKSQDKNIIMVQHTESRHHLNGMIGAWGDWELTEKGKKQAQEIGKWLQDIINPFDFKMYTSDLKRAEQTAKEINKYLKINPISTKAIREVNAGDGNGKSREWYDQNKSSNPDVYDPDYKPFHNAESDRELWKRLNDFLHRVITSETKNIILVSHGTALSFIQSILFGDKFEDISRRRFYGGSGSISKFTMKSEGKIIIDFINLQIKSLEES